MGTLVRRVWAEADSTTESALGEHLPAPGRSGTQLCFHHGRSCPRWPLLRRRLRHLGHGCRHVGIRQSAIRCCLCGLLIRRWLNPRPRRGRVFGEISRLALEYLDPSMSNSPLRSYCVPNREQLIFGGAVQLAHLLLVPETRVTIMMDRIAKKRRKDGTNPNLYGPNEITPFKERFSFKEVIVTWIRPFRMFLTEPIVLTLSLLSGFSDALIFMFIQSFSLVYANYDWGVIAQGLSFLPILIGYLIAYVSFIPAIRRNVKDRAQHPDDEKAQYESRLWWLLYTAPCLPIGLIGFAWTSGGPPLPWIASSIFAAVVGIANYSIYMATIDYMICAYGPYSASATGGNGWSRDFLAGVLTIPATPFFTNIGGKQHLQIASTILFAISFVLVLAVYAIYWYGPTLRARSPFAQQLQQGREETGGRRASVMPSGYGSQPGSRGHSAPNSRMGSRRASYAHSKPSTSGMGNREENNYVHERLAKMKTEQEAPSGV